MFDFFKYRYKIFRRIVTAIRPAIDEGTVSKLPEDLRLVAQAVEKELAAAGKKMKDMGLIEDTIESYAPHFWQHPTRSNTEMLRALFEDKTGKIPVKTILFLWYREGVGAKDYGYR